jgi:hypothetical protein
MAGNGIIFDMFHASNGIVFVDAGSGIIFVLDADVGSGIIFVLDAGSGIIFVHGTGIIYFDTFSGIIGHIEACRGSLPQLKLADSAFHCSSTSHLVLNNDFDGTCSTSNLHLLLVVKSGTSRLLLSS